MSTVSRKGPRLTVRVLELRCEYAAEPLGLGVSRPRFSWKVETAARDWHQQAYEIEVTDADSGNPVWSSGRRSSRESVLVAYGGPPLRSRDRVRWRVRVWDEVGNVSDWSEESRLEIGLLESSDWEAAFISPDWEEDPTETSPSPYLRREFEVRAEVVRARLYVTAVGVYEVEINGTRVGDEFLAPGWTSYRHRLVYQTHDVTALVATGDNAIGATLADGWACGYLGALGARNVYSEHLGLLAQLEITLADGTVQRVVTDERWRAAEGPIRAADLYNGETYDARRELDGWTRPGYQDDGWSTVRIMAWDRETLQAPKGPAIRRMEELHPASIVTSPSGKTIVDFGQNLVGYVRFDIEAPAATEIRLRHAEILNEGELYTAPLRTARATDTYICRGEGVETYAPRFTFHGFRYVEIEGWPGDLSPEDLVAVVCYSAMERTGQFCCSDELVNRLHENIVWSMRGNFLGVPTDCPQRDERLGWTGDIQVFGPTASYLYDVAGILASWLEDLSADQYPSGSVPWVIPDGKVFPESHGSTAWGDAAVIVPWLLYRRYGDLSVLERQYPSMCGWIRFVRERAGDDLIWSVGNAGFFQEGFQWGDWLDPAAPPNEPHRGITDNSLVASAYFVHSTEIVAEVAAILAKDDDAQAYRELASAARQAFRREFLSGSGRPVSDSPTACALVLAFDLVEGEERRRAADRLAELVERNHYRIATGFLGTPLVCPALTRAGYADVAYRLFNQREHPSWLYPVTKDATTIWERWDAILPDDSLNPRHLFMISFNHYAFGAIGEWMYSTVAGIAPGANGGWREFILAPIPGGGLSSAEASFRSPYGLIECLWRLEGESITIDATVPPNTTASVRLPGKEEHFEVGSGRHQWAYDVDLGAAWRSG
jgi:alpha-L-rhamnosidase